MKPSIKPMMKSLHLTRRPGVITLLAGVALALAPAGGMGQARRDAPLRSANPPLRRALVFRRAPQAPSIDPRARDLVALYLRNGVRQPYVGEQVTRLLQRRVVETRQRVECLGPARIRMDYIDPPTLKGEVILINGGRFYQYRPRRGDILDGVATPEELQARVRELLQGLRAGRIQVSVVGTEIVAGHETSIVEIRPARPGAGYLRFWIDDQTGVRLKFARMDAQGRAISETYFTSIDYAAPIDPRDLSPASLPRVPHVPRLPGSPPLASAQAAQPQVGYTIREPAIPQGFRLDGVWVIGEPIGRRATILRYTDGVNTFALFQVPAPNRGGVPAPNPSGVRPRLGVAHWIANGMAYTLIGHLTPESVQAIVASLK